MLRVSERNMEPYAQTESARYAAFISYRHVEPDRKWAKWLHYALETYHVPKRFVHERNLPQRIGRVFRDEEELATSPHLSKDIESALEQSRFLIIVCSPRTPASKWINAEVEVFRKLGRSDRILPLLIEGEPAISFPPALFTIQGQPGAPLSNAEEPLAADVRTLPSDSTRARRRMAKLRMLAAILGCQFDDLRQRDKERRRRNLRFLSVLVVIVVLIVGGLSGATWMQTQRQHEQASLRYVAEAYRVLYRDPIHAVVHAHRALQENPSDVGNVAHTALGVAHRVTLLHRSNQKDAATLTTKQAFSFEKRDRQGKVYTVISPDGRYVLLTTERRGEPYKPELPGEVYLLDNERRQTRKLEQCSGDTANMRLEYAGFSTFGQIFVTRGFYADTYDLEGNCMSHDSLFFEGTKSPIHLVAGYLNRKYLLAADSIGQVWLMDSTDRHATRPIDSLSGSEQNAVVAVALSSDGNAATLLYESGRVDLVRFGESILPYHWSVLSEGGLSTAFSLDRSKFQFLTTETSGKVRLWTVEANQLKETASFDHNSRPVDMAEFSEDGSRIVSIDADCKLWIWGSTSGRLERVIEVPSDISCERIEDQKETKGPTERTGGLSSSSPSEGPKPPATQTTTPQLLKDAPLQIRPEKKLKGHAGEIFDLAFSSDGRLLVSASGDGTVRVWDTAKAEKVHELLIQPFENVLSVAISTGQLIAAGTDKSTIKLWRATDGAEVSSAIPKRWGAVNDLAFSRDGRLLAVAAGKEELHVWNVADNAPLVTPYIGHGQVYSCAFTPDGKFLVVGNKDGSVVVLDVNTWSPVSTGSHAHQNEVTGLSIDNGGTFIASSDGTEILLWKIAPFQRTGTRMQPIGARVSAIALSPDGQVLAAGLGNGTIVFWQTITGEQLGTPLEGHNMLYVGSVTFSPDGRTLASGGGDKTAVLWSVGSE